MNADALRERLLALFSLHRPDAAAALADEALRRFAALGATPGDAAARLHAIAGELLAAQPEDPSAAMPEPDGVDEPDFDPATRRALRACFAQLGTDASKLILGYYEFGSDAGGDTVAARLRRRQQLAARLGLTPEALRDRAHEIRAMLEDGVQARLADERSAS